MREIHERTIFNTKIPVMKKQVTLHEREFKDLYEATE